MDDHSRSPHKLCPGCGEVKKLEAFCRNRRSKDGRATYCKPCHNKRGRETRKRLYGGSRYHHLKRRYGITPAEVDEMIRQQGGLCAACRKRPATQVDHDHKTGRVRGILCLNCNAALGAFKDDPRIVWAAIEYLETANGNPITDIAGL